MKKIIPLLLFITSLNFGCKSYKDEFDQVNLERDSLIYAADLKDSSIRLFMASFDEIESNLDTITQKQNNLEQDSIPLTELKGDQRERINDNIKLINRMLERNRKLISDLKEQNKLKDCRIAALQNIINKLNQQVENKEAELMPLKIQLDEKNQNLETLQLQVDTLTAKNNPKETKIKEKLDKFYSAYYIIDTYKKLRFNSIVDTKGGFLGIGQNQMLKQDFKTDGFTKINIEETTSIPLNCKSANIITNHPSDSYVLVREGDTLRTLDIKDYEKFWGASKYLVIVRN
jgi:DNA repair exonuclease SbcCD ATPase subunit